MNIPIPDMTWTIDTDEEARMAFTTRAAVKVSSGIDLVSRQFGVALVESLTLECGQGATGLDVVRLFRAQTLVTLEITRGCLDGPAFLTLADCHNLTALNISSVDLTSPEAAESITCLTQDFDAEALAGLSSLTKLDFHGPMELTRPHRLPKLKHLAFGPSRGSITPLQLDRLIGGSTSLRQIEFSDDQEELSDGLCLDISAMRNDLHLSTAMRSVSLALRQCCIRELMLFSDYSGKVRLESEVVEALVPLAETLRELYLCRIIVDYSFLLPMGGSFHPC
eukprot:gene10006-7890_t